MKAKFLFASAIAALAISSCNNDEEVMDNAFAGLDGENTYLAIAIDANNGMATRGLEGDGNTPNNIYDEANLADAEGAIETVSLFFYKGNGAVTPNASNNADATTGEEGFYAASTLFGWESVSGGTGSTNEETTGKAVVSFKNLTERTSPDAVLVVLNLTKDQYTAIKAMNKDQAEAAIYGNDNEANGIFAYRNNFANAGAPAKYRFIMSNSVYYDNGTVRATKITTADFGTSVDNAKEKAVEVYVERLASKVTVKGASTGSTTEQTQTGTNAEAAKEYAIQVTGWGLNAQNKSINVFKQLDASWNATKPWDGWNKSIDSRSYWAKDTNYGDGTYPTSYDDLKNVLENNVDADEDLKGSLRYFSYTDLATGDFKNEGGVAYCNENTLDKDAKEAVAATSVLVCAQLGTKVGGTFTALAEDLFNFNEVLMDKANYKAAAAAALKPAYTSIWIEYEDAGVTKWRNIASTDFKADVTNILDGYVTWELENTHKFVKEAKTGAAEWTLNEVNEEIAKLTKANGYKTGMMYYSVPIEHLNGSYDTNGKWTSAGDGDYGVVRNHQYEVNITSITNLGKGVWDPEERIVPNTETPKFFLGTRINVLSWHIVRQNTAL